CFPLIPFKPSTFPKARENTPKFDNKAKKQKLPPWHTRWAVSGPFVLSVHTLLQQLDKPVQEFRPYLLPNLDFDKCAVVIAQVHIEELFKMFGQFFDVHGATLDMATGVKGIQQLGQIGFGTGP